MSLANSFRKRYSFYFCLTFAIAILPSVVSAEIPKALFDSARTDYSELLKNDPRVSSLVQWEGVAAKLREVAVDYKDTTYAPRAAFLAGYLSEHQYRILKLPIFLARSVSFYRYLAREFKGDALADDALLSLGDLYRFDIKNEGLARASYLEIAKDYFAGDMADKAKQRLEEIRSSEISLGSSSSRPDDLAGAEVIIKNDHRHNRPLIVIDPGHGGVEDGAQGYDGMWEKELVLIISFKLEKLLEDRLRAKVILTRRSDIDVPLSGRTQLANEKGADLFVSVHANASVKKTARGIETYYLDNTNDASSIRLAERENRAFKRESNDLAFILSDLIQDAKLEASISLAHHLQNSLVSTLSTEYEDTLDLGVRKAPFFVLVGAHMPCALAEVSFIDHPVEGRRLNKESYQDLIAEALYKGIKGYFSK